MKNIADFLIKIHGKEEFLRILKRTKPKVKKIKTPFGVLTLIEDPHAPRRSVKFISTRARR